MKRALLTLLLAALALLLACGPVRRTSRGGGETDDDDATGDDDDNSDDDDAASTEAGVAWMETPEGLQELPAAITVSRIPGFGTTASLAAGEDVTCEGAAFFGMYTEEVWAALQNEAIDIDEYIEMVSGAWLDLFGPSSWMLMTSHDMGDEEAEVVFEPGVMPNAVTFALGRLAGSVEDIVDDPLDEGVISNSDGSELDGEVSGFQDGRLTGWVAIEGPWEGGELDGEVVHLHTDIEDAPVCE